VLLWNDGDTFPANADTKSDGYGGMTGFMIGNGFQFNFHLLCFLFAGFPKEGCVVHSSRVNESLATVMVNRPRPKVNSVAGSSQGRPKR
jgi:hypothetical protein